MVSGVLLRVWAFRGRHVGASENVGVLMKRSEQNRSAMRRRGPKSKRKNSDRYAKEQRIRKERKEKRV